MKRKTRLVSGKPSGTLTITDIARLAGVGVATVSRVLNNSSKVSPKTTAKIKKILNQTNYRPAYAARALASGRTNTIELLYNTTAAKLSQDPVLLSILDAVNAEIKRAGYRLAFSAISTDFMRVPRNFMQALEHRMADAALIVSAKMTDAALQRLQGLPVVILDYHGKGVVTSITNDNHRAAREAVTMVVKKGHQRVGYICSGSDDHNEKERFEGYVEGMKSLGIPRRPEFEMDFDQTRENMTKVLSMKDRPTVLLTTWTPILPLIFQILEEKGIRVPQDISLLTVDTAPGVPSSLTGLVRPVSCHRLEWDSIVKTAINEVLRIIRGDRQIRHIELPVSFHDEGTLAPPLSKSHPRSLKKK